MSGNASLALYTSNEIRVIEQTQARKSPRVSLMLRAGNAVAKLALTLVKKKKSASILVLAGPGNNGGDAWVAAAALKKAGQRVTVVALGDNKFADAASRNAHAAFVRAGEADAEHAVDDQVDVLVFRQLVDYLSLGADERRVGVA